MKLTDLAEDTHKGTFAIRKTGTGDKAIHRLINRDTFALHSMFFASQQEAEEWCSNNNVTVDNSSMDD